jgi:arylsulfatase
MTDIPVGNMPSLLNSSYTITAEIEVSGADAHGMLINEGGRYWGWGLYLVKGRPIFTYNLLGIKMTKWQGPVLSSGKHTIEFDFKYDGLGAATLAYNNLSGIGKGGTGMLKVDGKVVSTQKLEQTLPLTKHMDAVFNIGDASGTPVDDNDYQIPFKFTGKINHLTIKVDRPKLSQEDIQKFQEADRKSELNK